jgi:hypothetical protein
MVRIISPLRMVAFGLGLSLMTGLGGCTPGFVIDHVPEVIGGEPAGTPARPKTTYQYPAVHDMPPPRAAPTMSESEQIQVEKELQAARDRNEGKVDPDKKAAPAAEKTAKKTTKKKPLDLTKRGQTSGAKTNP